MNSADLLGNAYDRYMGRWSRRLTQPFIDFIGVEDGERWLDVGCGTGALAFAAARTGRARVVGIDSVPEFVEHARARAGSLPVSFEVGSADALPYEDGAFDKCASLLVLRFMRDAPAAIAEMRRVTRIGGTVAACVWDRDGMEMNSLFWRTAEELDAAVASRRNAQSYGGGQLQALWSGSGFQYVEERAIEIALDFECFDDFWLPLAAARGRTSRYVAALSAERQERLRERLREKLLPGADGAFVLRGLAWAVRGIRHADS